MENKGLDKLRMASMPDAIHDSSARYPPPRCSPDTREEYIHNITDWGFGGWERHKACVLLLQGPAGAGKSALAQTCAERIGDRLGTSFFFSRSNERTDPNTFVPTIVYQLATKFKAYRQLVDARIVRDPFVLEKSVDVQFRELLVKPLRELSSQGQQFGESIIIVDGLDECHGQDTQRVIIEVITASVLEQTMPFLWAFFSRPEPPIVAAFSLGRVVEICWRLTLPVSRNADREIEIYLRGGFKMIREVHHLPETIAWPPEENIRQLIEQCAGWFNYASSAIQYIAHSHDAFAPEQRLQLVLDVGETNSKNRSANPLLNLDLSYTLIMSQIPKEIVPNTLLLLFAHFHHGSSAYYLRFCCSIFNLSPVTARRALNNLHSVLEVESSDGMPVRLSLYHTSFGDFLCDVTRSKEFCVDTRHVYNRFYSACIDTLCHLARTSPVDGA